MLRIVISVLLILVSCLWMYMGIFEYGMWVPGVSADTGFIPTVFGAIVLLFSVIKLIRDIKAYSQARQEAVATEKGKASFLEILVKLKEHRTSEQGGDGSSYRTAQQDIHREQDQGIS